MARNLVKEKESPIPELPAQVPVEVKTAEPEVKIVTFEALIANNLEALNAKFDFLTSRILQMAKQVGVEFKD